MDVDRALIPLVTDPLNPFEQLQARRLARAATINAARSSNSDGVRSMARPPTVT